MLNVSKSSGIMWRDQATYWNRVRGCRVAIRSSLELTSMSAMLSLSCGQAVFILYVKTFLSTSDLSVLNRPPLFHHVLLCMILCQPAFVVYCKVKCNRMQVNLLIKVPLCAFETSLVLWSVTKQTNCLLHIKVGPFRGFLSGFCCLQTNKRVFFSKVATEIQRFTSLSLLPSLKVIY